MGFWDIAKKVGSGIVNTTKEFNEELKNLREKYQYENDYELFEMLKDHYIKKKLTNKEAVAIRQVLKERGYSSEDITREVKNLLS